jgi:hypothetical protein
MAQDGHPIERKEGLGRSAKMQFTLTGFTHDMGFRVFAFEGIGEDRIRTKFTVRADLALIRRYGIRVQELPLLCRSLLTQREDAEEARTLTFTEEDMRVHERGCAAAAAQKKRPPRKPATENLGAAWRGPQPR